LEGLEALFSVSNSTKAHRGDGTGCTCASVFCAFLVSDFSNVQPAIFM